MCVCVCVCEFLSALIVVYMPIKMSRLCMNMTLLPICNLQQQAFHITLTFVTGKTFCFHLPQSCRKLRKLKTTNCVLVCILFFILNLRADTCSLRHTVKSVLSINSRLLRKCFPTTTNVNTKQKLPVCLTASSSKDNRMELNTMYTKLLHHVPTLPPRILFDFVNT
jgi:hypothetical protein